jgi:hypothetical protein
MASAVTPEPPELAVAEARISRRSAEPVQSGRAHADEWIVEFEPAIRPDVDPLMGWLSSCDVLQQVRMSFPDLQSAESYCRREGLAYTVVIPHKGKRRPRSYAENFMPFEDGPPPLYQH